MSTKKELAKRILERYVNGNTDFGATDQRVNMYTAGKCTNSGGFNIPKGISFSIVDSLVGNAQDAVELAKLVLEESPSQVINNDKCEDCGEEALGGVTRRCSSCWLKYVRLYQPKE